MKRIRKQSEITSFAKPFRQLINFIQNFCSESNFWKLEVNWYKR